MVEPSQRCQRSLEKMAQYPKLGGRFQYLQAAVGNPKEESTRFFERPLWVDLYFLHPPKIAAMNVKTSPYQMSQVSKINLSISSSAISKEQSGISLSTTPRF